MHALSVIFLTFTVAPLQITIVTAQTTCTADGWFGTDCQYQCHCSDFAPCDKVDGSCSSGCHPFWFGPACQYNRISLKGSGLQWLSDNDVTTCNPGTNQSVDVELNIAIPLTWVRIVVSDTDYLKQIQLSYLLTAASSPQSCAGPRTANVDDLTLDIYCPTDIKVQRVILSGLGVAKLCSLDITGGRNVALKQTAQQSSTYFPGNDQTAYLAGHAVDGNVGDASLSSIRSTCTHTGTSESPDWWTVSFSQAVDINRFLIYNRRDECCKVRLVGFTLTAQPEPGNTATTYTYTDDESQPKDSYTVVPSPKIGYPVNQVRVDARHTSTILTLCEVYVLGEVRCPDGQFGLACERQCNCVNQTSCFVHSGGCPAGCASGFHGADCSECSEGTYGAGCSSNCSSNCAGPGNACHHVTGLCDACRDGKYGSDCSMPCDVNCGGPENVCDRDTGVCSAGCDPGYWGAECQKNCNINCGGTDKACHQDTGTCSTCPLGFYGISCSELCSTNCNGSNNACERVSGACVGCDPGFFGETCLNQCSSNCRGPDNECDRESGACAKCEPGLYGVDCTQPCRDACAGTSHPCRVTDGSCDEGCLEGYTGDRCDQAKENALPQREDSDGTDYESWAMAVTVLAAVVFVAAAVTIGLLGWKLRNATRSAANAQSSHKFASDGEEEELPKYVNCVHEGQTLSAMGTPIITTVENANQPQEYDKPIANSEESSEYMRPGNEYETPASISINLGTGDYELSEGVMETSEASTEITNQNVGSLYENGDFKESLYCLPD